MSTINSPIVALKQLAFKGIVLLTTLSEVLEGIDNVQGE